MEFSPIPFITEDIAPGTKIRLENRVPINSGILCLSAKNVGVIRGTIQSLYEEWQMNQKFSGLSRPSLRSQNDDGVGPPPFEKLDTEACPTGHSSCTHILIIKLGTWESLMTMCWLIPIAKPLTEASSDVNREITASKLESKQSSSDSRPKEVSEAVPVQNQAAAQKLLQKMSMPEDSYGRGHRFKGKGKQEDTPVFTLDEWERRKAVSSMATAESYIQDTSRDEELEGSSKYN